MIRFLIGGFVVSAFATLGDLFKPKSFAGLFGAAPSVALATLGLTIVHQGKVFAATEARFMIAGAAAFFIYANAMRRLMMRFDWPALPVTMTLISLWLGSAFGFWLVMGILQ